MKKIVLVLSAIVLAFTACINTSNKQTGNDGDTVKVEIQEVEVPVVKDTLRTPDLSLFNLQGPVEKITEAKGDLYNASFDKQGRITYIGYPYGDIELTIAYDSSESGNVKESGGHKVKRDKEGRVLSIPSGGDDGCGAPGFDFNYTNGHLSGYSYSFGYCTGEEYHDVVTVDEQGRITKERSGWDDVEESEEITTTYIYTKFDEWVNWTERSFKQKVVHTEIDRGYYNEETNEYEERDIIDRSSNSGVETRVITYYE